MTDFTHAIHLLDDNGAQVTAGVTRTGQAR